MDPLKLPRHRCPHCDHLLRDWQLGAVIVEGCDECGGVWFDAAELAAVAREPGEPLVALESEFTRGLGGAAGGGRSRCPKDGTPLQPKRFKQLSALEVEACPSCSGIWLDEGEAAALAAQVPRVEGPSSAPAGGARPGPAGGGRVQTVFCLACGSRNPALQSCCADCGGDLHAPPDAGGGNLLSDHPFRLSVLLGELATLALLAWWLLAPRDLSAATLEATAGWRLSILALLVAGYLLRWPFRATRAQVTPGGLELRRWIGRKFVPWEAIRGAAVFDLGTRALWYPLTSAFGRRRYGSYGSDREAIDELLEPPAALMILSTARGLVILGPSLTNHFVLLDQVRDRMNP